jgi:hypothetical protein
MDAPGAYENVFGEPITFNGTNLVALRCSNVIQNTLTVYGTNQTGATVFIEGADFMAWYYGVGLSGTRCGYVQALGTTGTMTVLVDYKYRKDNVFKLNDFRKWGFPYLENRG